jgi:cobalt-zinc-cadmium efflux system membrane fusion protein
MKKTAFQSFTLALATITFGCGVAGCGSGTTESESKMTSYSGTEAKADTASLFTVPPEQMAHIQVVSAERAKIARLLRLTGNVTYNAFKTTPVFSAIGGPVHEILVAPGETVKAGQPLLTVNSPDYSTARSAYIKTRDAYALAQKIYARADDLYRHGAIAEADLQQAESGRTQAQADMQSSEDALRALGVNDPEAVVKNPPKMTSQISVIAPVGGEIVERLVGPGQLLQGGATQVFTISDMSSVWILVNVYQSDLGYVHVGDSVDITTDSYSELFHGKISYVSAALDPSTRTLQARIVTGNPAKKLRKDMYVTAAVMAGAIRDALTVPEASILRDTENQPFVYVQSGANQFARRPVKVGDNQNGRTQVTEGLKEGERVVGDGGLFLQFKNSLQH